MEQLRIQEARKACGISQQELAERIDTSQAAVQRWESGARNPKISTLIKIAEACNVSISYLLGMTDDPEPSTGIIQQFPSAAHMMPVFGRISAGTPREALHVSDEMHPTEESLYLSHKSGFWLRVSGNSMNRLFPDGSLVLIDPDQEVRNGDVAVVFVNGDDATLKRVYFDGDTIRLHPESYDNEYIDRVIDGSDPDSPAVRIIGKAVAYASPEGWRA